MQQTVKGPLDMCYKWAMWWTKKKPPSIYEQEEVVIFSIGFKEPIGSVYYNDRKGVLFRITRHDPALNRVQSDGAIQNANVGIPILQLKCSWEYGWLVSKLLNDIQVPARAAELPGMLRSIPEWLDHHPDTFRREHVEGTGAG